MIKIKKYVNILFVFLALILLSNTAYAVTTTQIQKDLTGFWIAIDDNQNPTGEIIEITKYKIMNNYNYKIKDAKIYDNTYFGTITISEYGNEKQMDIVYGYQKGTPTVLMLFINNRYFSFIKEKPII